MGVLKNRFIESFVKFLGKKSLVWILFQFKRTHRRMLTSGWVLFEFILDGVFSDLVKFKLQYLNRGVLNYLNYWFFSLLSFFLFFFFLVSEVFIIPLMKTKMVIYEVLRYSCEIFVWSGIICKKCLIRKKWNGDVAYLCYSWGLRWIGGKYVVFIT